MIWEGKIVRVLSVRGTRGFGGSHNISVYKMFDFESVLGGNCFNQIKRVQFSSNINMKVDGA